MQLSPPPTPLSASFHRKAETPADAGVSSARDFKILFKRYDTRTEKLVTW